MTDKSCSSNFKDRVKMLFEHKGRESFSSIVAKFLFLLLSSALIYFIYIRDHELIFILSASCTPIVFCALANAYLKNDWGSFKLAIAWGVAGVFMLLLSIYADSKIVNDKINSLILNVGTTLISLSIIGVVFQLKDTKEYFAQALSDLIIQSTYIDRLSPDKLHELQKNIVQKIFGNSKDLEKENSFYNFYMGSIHSFIGMPYREGYINTIAISDANGDFKIDETHEYRIRAMGDKLQEDVRWESSPDEIKKLISLCIYINSNLVFSWSENSESNKESDSTFENFSNPSVGVKFQMNIKEFCSLNKKLKEYYKDNSLITLKAVYEASKYKSVISKLLYPTFNFKLIVFHHDGVECKLDNFGFDETSNKYSCSKSKNGAALNYSGWLLPESGTFVSFNEKVIDAKADSDSSNLLDRIDDELQSSDSDLAGVQILADDVHDEDSELSGKKENHKNDPSPSSD